MASKIMPKYNFISQSSDTGSGGFQTACHQALSRASFRSHGSSLRTTEPCHRIQKREGVYRRRRRIGREKTGHGYNHYVPAKIEYTKSAIVIAISHNLMKHFSDSIV